MELVSVAMAPELLPMLMAYLDSTRTALAPYVTGSAYINFLEGDEKRDRRHPRSAPRASPASARSRPSSTRRTGSATASAADSVSGAMAGSAVAAGPAIVISPHPRAAPGAPVG